MEFTSELLRRIIDEDAEGFEIVDHGHWEDDGKYSYCEIIFRSLTDEPNKYYCVCDSRSGSYFSEYNYSENLKAVEVERVEVVKHEWRPVKREGGAQ